MRNWASHALHAMRFRMSPKLAALDTAMGAGAVRAGCTQPVKHGQQALLPRPESSLRGLLQITFKSSIVACQLYFLLSLMFLFSQHKNEEYTWSSSSSPCSRGATAQLGKQKFPSMELLSFANVLVGCRGEPSKA